ncbi:MAG: penicillin-binding protein [Chloroflexi bacterium HGW-Chloroflexi-1]|nr:MAG: penicillin-binding protein [Chloroflexi bacterium HGW-Chloroflexi-1]
MRRIHRLRVLLISTGGLLIAALLLYLALFADLPNPARVKGTVDAPSILITDRHGQLLYEVIDPDGNKNVPLPLAEIPLVCQQATIATEDGHFYSHPGIDPTAIVRAAWQNWHAGYTVSGASTLTQQLARNLYMTEPERIEQSLRRKLREAWLAWRLEQVYSKDELLALYLNTTYYGHFAVGIEAAAQAYFGMHAAELDLAQCALLAGLPQYPSGYNPTENPEAARYRQRVVLDLLVKDGYITRAQAADASREGMAYASTPFPIEAPHFVMWVQGQLEELLGADRLRAGGLRVTTTLDLDWQHQAEAIVRRRLAGLQPCAAGAAPLTCDPLADPARRVNNAALVALDPGTGAVLALVGSPDYFDPAISGAVNAALSPRQPGSAIKPLTYAAALDPARAARAGQMPWTPATVIADLRTVFPTQEGRPYAPQNYDLRYHGPVPVRAALANSYNIPAVKTLQFIGVDALVELAARLGITWDQENGYWVSGIDRTEAMVNSESIQYPIPNTEYPIPNTGLPVAKYGLALTLGGGEVRLLDLTAAYAAFANGGQRVTPFGIERIETLEGEDIGYWVSGIDGRRWQVAEGKAPIANRKPQTTSALYATRDTSSPKANIQYPIPNTILDPRVAFLITDILSDETARLPAFGPGNVLEIGRPAAAKTGTTTDWRDNWTVGYTPELATGVWAGNADNTPMRDVSGITGAGPIWHDFMISVLRDTPPQAFARPDGLLRVEVCADSGLLPLDRGLTNPEGELAPRQSASQTIQSEIANPKSQIISCPNRRFEWFITGTEPADVDASHVQVAIDVRTGGPVDDATPPEYVRPRAYWILPHEYQAWARENGIPQPPMVVGAGSQVQQVSFNVERSTCNLQLTSPDPNQTYRLDPGLPPSAQKLPITARPGPALEAQGAPVTLLLDGAPFATVGSPDYTAWWPLSAGQHTFQAVATGANGRKEKSEPITVFVVE